MSRARRAATPKPFDSDGFVKTLTALDDEAQCIEALHDLKYELRCCRDSDGAEALQWFTVYHESVIDAAIKAIAGHIGHKLFDTSAMLKDCQLLRKQEVQP